MSDCSYVSDERPWHFQSQYPTTLIHEHTNDIWRIRHYDVSQMLSVSSGSSGRCSGQWKWRHLYDYDYYYSYYYYYYYSYYYYFGSWMMMMMLDIYQTL